MPNDADRAGTPAGVFGAELRFYRTRTGAPQLWCILDEYVLHRAIGGPKVMRSQLYRLAEVAEHPRTTIQVIRAGGAHAGLLSAFTAHWHSRRPDRSFAAPLLPSYAIS